MHPRLEGWLQKWLKQKKKEEDDSPPPCEAIPTLPSPHPRPITPTPDNGLMAQPQTHSPFFSRLPLEVRQLIYTHLFGNRVVHVELGYQYPRKPGGLGHAGWGSLGPGGRIIYRKDQSNGERWISQGCGCCRDPECCWWDDGCIVGWGIKCSSGQVRDCTINANWLLVCRQGYLESIDILYSTNTFHLRHLSALLPHSLLSHPSRKTDGDDPDPEPNQLTLLAATLLPHRFAQISRLHVRAYSPIDPPHPSYARLCRTVLLLPALRELRLAVEVRNPRWKAGGPATDRRIPAFVEVAAGPALDAAWLGVVDEMVAERRLGFVEFVVGETWWEAFDRRGGEVVQGDGGGEYRRFWRVVEGEEGENGTGGGGLGYWVAGMPDPWVPAMASCFCSG